MVEERLQGLLLGLVLADHGMLPVSGRAEQPAVGVGAGTELVTSGMASLLARHGFDGADLARRLCADVSRDSAAFTPLERLVAGMVEDGAIWDEPAQLLRGVPDAATHHPAVRALAAAILAPEDAGYRSWLVERIVEVTHRSADAVRAATVAAEAAAPLLRGEQIRLMDLGAFSRTAQTSADTSSTLRSVDLVLSVVAIVAAAPDASTAVAAVASHGWADARAVALAGALAGAHAPEGLPRPATPEAQGAVDRAQLLAGQLADRGRSYTRARGA